MNLTEKAWESEYFHELKGARRKELLNKAIETEGNSPENELRGKLLEARYGKSEGSQPVDFFLRGWMSLEFMGNSSKFFWGKRKKKKELESLLQGWKFDMARSYGEAGEKVLYQELCNLALLYISLCREDQHYNSVILGIGHIKNDTLVTKIMKDILAVAYEVPLELGASEELEMLSRAAGQMFCESFPEAREEFEQKVEEFRNGRR